MKDLLQQLTKPLHQEVYEDLDKLKKEYGISLLKGVELESELNDKETITKNLQLDKELLQKRITALTASTTSRIDTWLSRQFTRIPNFAYKQKRQVTIKQDKKKTEVSGTYSVFLNEMITPDAFEVMKYASKFPQSSIMLFYQQVAKKFTDDNVWVNEPDLYKTGDVYLLPAEVLSFAIKKIDCDDCTHTLVSLKPKDAACVLGFFIDDNGNEIAHAYPIFVDENDKAWIVETTGDVGQILPFDDKHYRHHFIYTKDNTYQLRNDVQFGYLDTI